MRGACDVRDGLLLVERVGLAVFLFLGVCFVAVFVIFLESAFGFRRHLAFLC